MPLSLRRGTVTAIDEEHDELVRLEVDGTPCVAYPRLTGAVAVGDDVLVNEQARDVELASDLGGMPVVCCTVHSQVVPVCAALAGIRVAYVQVAGGALPVSLSDTVRVLKERGLVEVAVAAAPCVDGDV